MDPVAAELLTTSPLPDLNARLRRGVVTQNYPLLVRVGAATTAVPAIALGSYVPAVNDVVSLLEIDGDRLVLGTAGPTAANPLADRWANMDLNNGTATTPTVFATAYNLLGAGVVAPVNLTMTVTAFAHAGFSVGSPGLQLRVLNQAGTNITKNSDGYAYVDLNGATWNPITVLGAFDYNAGDTVGCALSYAVTANNAYVRAGVRVQLARR